MTTLADVKTGDQFLFVCLAGTIDANGMALSLYGPSNVLAATAQIAPTGAMSGQLMAPSNQIPVSLVSGFVSFTVGDVLQKQSSGETMVCRWSHISPDGTTSWSASQGHEVIYSNEGWSVIGHVQLSEP